MNILIPQSTLSKNLNEKSHHLINEKTSSDKPKKRKYYSFQFIQSILKTIRKCNITYSVQRMTQKTKQSNQEII